jgi:hypothetical protein
MRVSHAKSLQSGKKLMTLRFRLEDSLNTWPSTVLTAQSANSAIHWQGEVACTSHAANANMNSAVAAVKHSQWEPSAPWDQTVPSWGCMLITHATVSSI